MNITRIISFLFLCGLFINSVHAKMYEYTREHIYVASSLDDRHSSRVNSIDEVKLSLLNELATHIWSRIEIKENSFGEHFNRVETVALTASLV